MRVFLRDAGLLAEGREDGLVEVVLADELASVAEQVLALLAGLAVDRVALRRTDELPGVDEPADGGIDRLVERAGSTSLPFLNTHFLRSSYWCAGRGCGALPG
ncbi:hypothetical protein [Streptomyces sp. B93]|uniref:hypothetical protein n=1 Tax=Streptomyces sp. B93 TaxID=2824875 RepID=UPI001B389F46|nr:hypothetical protein [Streptomyces sp. B93]MBQ1090076.1 hypothetical protein [Streptomyces sp. B93]